MAVSGKSDDVKSEVGSAEVYFAKKLANNDKKIRDRSVKRLKLWISSKVKAGIALEEADMLKLWKGLFYCMWYSDKPLIQEDLADNLAKILYLFNPPSSAGITFAKVFFVTMGREWHGIDRLRVDKFYLLIKNYIEATFQYLGNSQWDQTLVKQTSTFLTDIYLNEKYPDDLKRHFGEYAIEEFVKACEKCKTLPDDATLLCLLEPFFSTIAFSKRQTVRNVIRTEVLMKLFTLNVSTEDEEGNTATLNVPFTLFADRLFELASKKSVPTKHRKILFSFTNKYRKHVADVEAASTAEKKKKKRKKRKVTDTSDPVVEINSDIEAESFDEPVPVTATDCNADDISENTEVVAETPETSIETESLAEAEPSVETEPAGKKKKKKKKKRKTDNLYDDSNIVDINDELLNEGSTISNIDTQKSSDCSTRDDTQVVVVEGTTEEEDDTKTQPKKKKKKKKRNRDISPIADTNEKLNSDFFSEDQISDVISLSEHKTLLRDNDDSIKIIATENSENITPDDTRTEKKKVEVIDIEAEDLIQINESDTGEFIIDEGEKQSDKITEIVIGDSDQEASVDMGIFEKSVVSDIPCEVAGNSNNDVTDSVVIQDENEKYPKEVLKNEGVSVEVEVAGSSSKDYGNCVVIEDKKEKHPKEQGVSESCEKPVVNDDDIMFEVEEGRGTAVVDLTLSSEEHENSDIDVSTNTKELSSLDNTGNDDDTVKNTDSDVSEKNTGIACDKTSPVINTIDDDINNDALCAQTGLNAGDILEVSEESIQFIDNAVDTSIENTARNDEVSPIPVIDIETQEREETTETFEIIADPYIKEIRNNRSSYQRSSNNRKNKRNSSPYVPVIPDKQDSMSKRKKSRSNYFDPIVDVDANEEVDDTSYKNDVIEVHNVTTNSDQKEAVNEVSVNLIEPNNKNIAGEKCILVDSESISINSEINESDVKGSKKKKKRKSLHNKSVSKNKPGNVNNDESIELSDCCEVTEQTPLDDVKMVLFSSAKEDDWGTKDDWTTCPDDEPNDVVLVDDNVVTDVKKSNKKKRRKSKLDQVENQTSEKNNNKYINIDDSVKDCMKNKTIVDNNTTDNSSLKPCDVTLVDGKYANEYTTTDHTVKEVKKSNKKKRVKSKLTHEEKHYSQNDGNDTNIDVSVATKAVVNSNTNNDCYVNDILINDSLDNDLKNENERSGFKMIDTPRPASNSKRGKRKKSIRDEDSPQPFVSFVKTATPAAFVRKAVTKVELLKKKKLKEKNLQHLSTPQSEPGKKKVRIELSNNTSVAHKDFKVSPLPAFSPTRKPVKSSIKVASIKKRRRASDFF